jgi:hypothetical protein
MADTLDRRAFFSATLPMLVAGREAPDAVTDQSEAGVYRFEIPPKCKLWGAITFLGEDMVEVTVASRRRSQAARGRFDGKRLVELTLDNSTTEADKISLSAKAVDGVRELPWGGVRFVSEQNLFVGFGHRAKPVELSQRHGGYPHDAVFLGFIVFDG